MMNYKNFYPRKEGKPKQTFFNSSGINENSAKRVTMNKVLNRKSDFNVSDDDIEVITKLPTENIFKGGKFCNKNSISDMFIDNKTNFKPLNVKIINDKMDQYAPNQSNFKIYNTIEEKLKLLENLDNCNVTKKGYLGLDRPIVEGICQDMCPEKERYLREFQDNVSIFEKNEKGQFDHRRAVKCYGRCSIDQKESLAQDLRPTDVLQRTMYYMLTNIVDIVDEKVTWRQWYGFLWDRTRSIRKDITQQNLCNETVVNIVESITRFHIFCSAWLCEEPNDNFNQRMNDDHLKNCLQTLKNMYADMPIDSCPNEAEFRSYMIVLNLDKGEMLDEAQKLTSSVFHSPKLTFAISVYQAVSTNNYVRFFRLLEQSDLMLSCLMHRFIVPMRLRAFAVINKVYMTNKFTADNRTNQMPLSTVSRQLKFENADEALEFCDLINQKWVAHPENNNPVIVLNPLNLVLHRRPELIRKAIVLVETKQGSQKLSAIFNGGQLDVSGMFQVRSCRMVSFDPQGCYIGAKQVPPPAEVLDHADEEVISVVSSDEEAARLNISASPLGGDSGHEANVQEAPHTSVFATGKSSTSEGNSATSWSNVFGNRVGTTANSNIFGINVAVSDTSAGSLFATDQQRGFAFQHFDLSSGIMVQQPIKSQFSFTKSAISAPAIEIVNSVPLVAKKPVMSPVDIDNFAETVTAQLISEFVKSRCENQILSILENENFRKLETEKIQEGLYIYFIREAIRELARTQNVTKEIVAVDVVTDLTVEVVDEQICEMRQYAEEKKRKSEFQTLNQMRYYFKCWRRHARNSITDRKCLTKLPGAPRLTDDFTVCEEFRGKVRKISTQWFESRDVSWHKHPIICRLEQATRSSLDDPAATMKRYHRTQTFVSYCNKTRVNVNQFIRYFVKSRFIDILDVHVRVLKVAGKVDPTPEIMIADYNRLIDEMLAYLELKVNVPFDLFKLKLPIVTMVSSGIVNDWQTYLDAIFTNLELEPTEKSLYIAEGCDIFHQLNHSPDRGLLSFHFRLFPWIKIIKRAVLNKLDNIDHRVSNFDIYIETNSLSVVQKLHLERIAEEMTVEQCIEECKKFQKQFNCHQIKMPKFEIPRRSLLFNSVWDRICQLQKKINECKENF